MILRALWLGLLLPCWTFAATRLEVDSDRVRYVTELSGTRFVFQGAGASVDKTLRECAVPVYERALQRLVRVTQKETLSIKSPYAVQVKTQGRDYTLPFNTRAAQTVLKFPDRMSSLAVEEELACRKN